MDHFLELLTYMIHDKQMIVGVSWLVFINTKSLQNIANGM